jgi:hypothetical protein
VLTSTLQVRREIPVLHGYLRKSPRTSLQAFGRAFFGIPLFYSPSITLYCSLFLRCSSISRCLNKYRMLSTSERGSSRTSLAVPAWSRHDGLLLRPRRRARILARTPSTALWLFGRLLGHVLGATLRAPRARPQAPRARRAPRPPFILWPTEYFRRPNQSCELPS